MSKILVTGGAGFIGSNLCESLLADGHEVTCLDNFSTGFRANIEPFFLLYPDRFRLIEGDIRDIDMCRAAVYGQEYVLHEAALGSVPRSIKDPATTNAVNIGGFLNMIIAICLCRQQFHLWGQYCITKGRRAYRKAPFAVRNY